MNSPSQTPNTLAPAVHVRSAPLTPTQEELLAMISTQHDAALAVWRGHYELDQGTVAKLASKDDVMQWAATVRTETILGLEQYGEPRLKLLPDMEVAKLMQVMDQHPTIPGQRKGYIGWGQWRKVAAPAGSFGLTTDIQDMPFDPTIFYQNVAQEIKRANQQMVAEYKRRFEQTPGATIMPQHAYIGSAMDAMARGQVYDKQFWTAFERPQGAGGLPSAYWNLDHVGLYGDGPDVSSANLRGRVWVPGEKA